jgi:hypothetical protein
LPQFHVSGNSYPLDEEKAGAPDERGTCGVERLNVVVRGVM